MGVFDDFHFQIPRPFVDIVLLDKKFQKSDRLLSSIGVYFGHVQIINEDYHMFAKNFGTEDSA